MKYLDHKMISIHEYNLLAILAYDCCKTDELIARALAESAEAARRGVLIASDKRDCTHALARLMEKGMVCTIDSAKIAKIVETLIEDRAYGPLAGLPCNGCVDITLAGADLWSGIERLTGQAKSRAFQMEQYSDFMLSLQLCCSSKKGAAQRLSDCASQEDESTTCRLLSVDGPRAIGRWRDRWWRTVIPRGYRVDALFHFECIINK